MGRSSSQAKRQTDKRSGDMSLVLDDAAVVRLNSDGDIDTTFGAADGDLELGACWTARIASPSNRMEKIWLEGVSPKPWPHWVGHTSGAPFPFDGYWLASPLNPDGTWTAPFWQRRIGQSDQVFPQDRKSLTSSSKPTARSSRRVQLTAPPTNRTITSTSP